MSTTFDELRAVVRANSFNPVVIALADGRWFEIWSLGGIKLSRDHSQVYLDDEAIALQDVVAIGPVPDDKDEYGP